MISFFVVLVMCRRFLKLLFNNYWNRCFSCPVDRGFGGPLTCLKNKILKECREFHAWRTDMLTERNGEKLLSEDKIDEQGTDRPYLLSRCWPGAILLWPGSCKTCHGSHWCCNVLETLPYPWKVLGTLPYPWNIAKVLEKEKSSSCCRKSSNSHQQMLTAVEFCSQVLEYLKPEDKIVILT